MPVPALKPTSCLPASSFAAAARQWSPDPIRCHMSQPPKPRGLGRGLSALLGDADVAATVAVPSKVEEPESEPTPVPGVSRPPLALPITRLRPGRMQPRTTFDGLDPLVESVKA